MTARWPQLPALWIVAVVVSSLVSVVTQNAALAIVMGFAVGAWMVAGMRVRFTGGGFRPLRTVDLLEFNAADQLDAYDREQAMSRARAR